MRHGLVEILQERLKNASTTHISKQNIVNTKRTTYLARRPGVRRTVEIECLKVQRTDPFTWASEYMNQPIERGKVFKPEWIRWAPFSGTAKPSGAVIFWDLSYKAAGDYKACAVVGSHDGCLLLLEVFCRRCELAEAMDWHYERIDCRQWRSRRAGRCLHTTMRRPLRRLFSRRSGKRPCSATRLQSCLRLTIAHRPTSIFVFRRRSRATCTTASSDLRSASRIRPIWRRAWRSSWPLRRAARRLMTFLTPSRRLCVSVRTFLAFVPRRSDWCLSLEKEQRGPSEKKCVHTCSKRRFLNRKKATERPFCEKSGALSAQKMIPYKCL